MQFPITPEKAKQTLKDIIKEISDTPALFVMHPEKDFTRRRKLPFDVLTDSMLAMRDKSLCGELSSYFEKADRIMSQSAYVQARQKILPEAFQYIYHEFTEHTYVSHPIDGFNMICTDGSELRLPKDESEPTWIPVTNSANGGYNAIHLNVLYDMGSGMYLDAFCQDGVGDERDATIRMLKRSKLKGKNLLLADRGYAGFNFFEHLNRTPGLDYLVRVKENFCSEIEALPMEDFDIDLTIELRTTQTTEDKKAFAEGRAKYISGPSKFGKVKKSAKWDHETPFTLTLRVVRFKISDNTWETAITSLDRNKYPPEVVKTYYHYRWSVETSFRNLKHILKLIYFHSKTKQLILQEIYARLTMYNFSALITHYVVIKTKSNTRHVYKANYTHAVSVCIRFFIGKAPPEDVAPLISKFILPVRPGRQDDRNKRHIRPQAEVCFIYRSVA